MSEVDSAAADGPTLDAENVRETNGGPSDDVLPREALDARARLATLARGDASPAATADEPATEPDAPTDETAEGTPEKSKALLDLEAKYGGDLNKMAESYWESSREQSRIADEVRAMRESVEAIRNERQTAIPEFEPAPEDIPSQAELQYVVDDIAMFESDAKDAQSNMDRILDLVDDLKAQINRAEGRAEAAEDPDEKVRRQNEVKDLVARHNAEARSFREAKEAKVRAERSIKSKERERVAIERRIEAERRQLTQAHAERNATLREQGEVFDRSIDGAFRASGLPESERSLYGETLTAKVGAYLRSLGPKAPPLSTADLVKVTEAEAAKLAKLHGLGARQTFTAASREKLATNAALKSSPSVGVGAKPPQFKSVDEEASWHKIQARARLAAAAARGRQA